MKKIIWIDDNYSEFERLQKEFSSLGQLDYELIYFDLAEILDESGAMLEELLAKLDKDRDIVLLDWNGGQIDVFYNPIRENAKCCLLVSWNSYEEVIIQGAFLKWPEFEKNFLQKQISSFRLLEKISELEKISKINVNQGADVDVAATDVMQIHDLLAIRFLNENFQAIAVTDGWKMDRDKPLIQFNEIQKSELMQGSMVQQNMFTTLPNEPDKFGPAQFFTKKLPSVGKATWPELAVYYQSAFSLPATGLGLEELGKSVDGIISLMRQAGFARGKFYQLAKIPGMRDLSLELVARYPDEDGNLPLPIAKEIHEIEHKILLKYKNKYEECKKHGKQRELIFEIVDARNPGGNDDFWSLCINNKNSYYRLEVPVFLTNAEINENSKIEYGDLAGVRGVFVFDRGNRDALAEKHVKAIEPILLSAINYFNIARRKEHDLWENKLSLELFELHKKLLKIGKKSELLYEMLQFLLALDGLNKNNAGKIDGNFTRSASFAEYDAGQQKLKVVCETEESMLDFEFSMDQEFFFMVQCANNALNGNYNPVIQADFDVSDKAMELRRKEFLKLKICQSQPELLERSMMQIKNTGSVIGFPVYLNDDFLGVVALRSTLPHDFTLRWISCMSRAIEVAAPYLLRFKNEARRRNAWDSLVMHEMRANLTWAMAKLDFLQHARNKDERIQSAEDLMHVLQDGSSLSSLFLQWLGNQDTQRVVPTDDDFWKRLDDYGKFREDSSEKLKWKFSFNAQCKGVDAIQYERALRILIDNAFRYASGLGDTISCEIQYSEDRKYVQAKIINPGQLTNIDKGNVLMPDELAAAAPKNFKAKIGLSLVAVLCRKAEVPPPVLSPDCTDTNAPRVVATLYWPIFDEKRSV